MTGTPTEDGWWLLIAGCLFFANYKLLQRPPVTASMLFFSYLHADAMDKLLCFFQHLHPWQHPPFEKLHIKGELRGIQSVLPDLVVPERPIKHHHSWFPSPLYLFIYSSGWLFHFSLPFSQPHIYCVIFVFHGSSSRSASPSYTHSQGMFCLFPASCSLFGDLISCMYGNTNLEHGVYWGLGRRSALPASRLFTGRAGNSHNRGQTARWDYCHVKKKGCLWLQPSWQGCVLQAEYLWSLPLKAPGCVVWAMNEEIKSGDSRNSRGITSDVSLLLLAEAVTSAEMFDWSHFPST